MALILALFAMTLLTYIALEVTYDTSVDYVVASQQVNRVKAYYAAKSGVELSLLRIMLYKQVMSAMGDALGPNKSMLDPIWSFPFMWPPNAMAAEGMTEVDKSMIGSVVKESFMGAQYAAQITPEGGRIDINDLGSDVKKLKQAMIQQVVRVYESEVENNDEFSDKYRGQNWQELVNNIADYIDEDSESLNGGDESAAYRDLEVNTVKMPPNRPLRTVDELHQVAGMTDDFFNVLKYKITVYGTKGINVNFADKATLMTLDISMNEEAVNKAIERRSNPKEGGPFANNQDFLGFLSRFGVNVKAIEESIGPWLQYGMEFNFRVSSTGVSSNVQREITAITYDYDNLTSEFVDMLNKQEQDQSGAPATPPKGDPPKKKIQAGKGRPTVVSWEEN